MSQKRFYDLLCVSENIFIAIFAFFGTVYAYFRIVRKNVTFLKGESHGR